MNNYDDIGTPVYVEDYIDSYEFTEELVEESKVREPEILLDDFQMRIINNIEKLNVNLFLSGMAGTGKSAIIKYLFKHTKKNAVLLAPTGIAALNIGGQTIHSFFKLSITDWLLIPENEIEKLKHDSLLKDKINKTDLIVIDEISMVRADLFHTIDQLCRFMREEPNKLFGGIQIVIVGDMMQLPPVVKNIIVDNVKLIDALNNKYHGKYFINSPEANLIGITKLTKVYRQEDKDFIEALNAIRINKDISKALTLLNTRVSTPNVNDVSISICATNEEVNKINKKELSKLTSPFKNYGAIIEGDFKDFPTDQQLKLKVGAHIIMLNNDSEYRWVNGSLGIIKSLEKGIWVEIDGITYDVQQYTWEAKRYIPNKETGMMDSVTVGKFIQYPIKLAWAITIHKSQGQTFDSVFINLDRIFEKGQTYVALSRCKHLETLYLNRPLKPSDIKVDPLLEQFK